MFDMFIWQNPKIFQYGGLFLKIWGKRYRIFKWGRR